MRKFSHPGPPKHRSGAPCGRRVVSVDRVPLTLVPFYRDYLIQMQNSMSDPVLTSCRSQELASGCPVNRSRTSQLSGASKGQPDDDTKQCKSDGPGVTNRSWLYGNPLACIHADVAARNLRKAIGKGNALKEERIWADNNFPKHRRSGRFCTCVARLGSDEVKPADRVIGRQVAPQQFILSFNKTKGGISYTLGSWSGGRGFFVHPPVPSGRRPGLQQLQDGQQEARHRRQRHLQRRVERAQELARRRRPVSTAPEVPPETPPPVVESATRAALEEFAEVPLWEADPDDIPEKRTRKHRKLRPKRSERALWQRITQFFAGKPASNFSSEQFGGGLQDGGLHHSLQDALQSQSLQSQSVELHPCPESLGLPGGHPRRSSDVTGLPRRSSDDSESAGRRRHLSPRGRPLRDGAQHRGRSRVPGH